MALKHVRTDDPNSTHTNTRTRLLEKVLSRHALDGLDALELRRHMGKNGYVPTPHRWECDGDGEDLTDEDGAIVLIGGTSPTDLANEIVETARQHVEETGERKNYRIVGLRRVMDDEGEEEEEQVSFQFLLPASLLGNAGDELGTGTELREHHDTMMSTVVQLQRQNDGLFRVLMDVVRQYPMVLGKSTELLERLGDQLGGGRQHDLQQVLSILEHESTREQRLLEHELLKQRSSQRAEMFGKSIDIAGPDLMVLLRKVIEMATTQQARAQAEPESAANEPPRGKAKAKAKAAASPTVDTTATEPSQYAQRLERVLAKVPKGGMAKARALLPEDDWALIEAARAAATDDEFAAIFTKLGESWTAKGEAVTQDLMAGLFDALGMQALALGQLIEEVRGG
ncbi:hypothetical protein [Paraliomyxa miuraensis]|uniref:hypothetical protein n=1 Tax=Paraliomyxa miuraensis TaxID=376150 RepID=UPI0022534974|nr:hypothetical protein [Paraliomyxa miuraensis]MCX4239088.1 hypothetical protein [Paraliomyxa miuraensis]